jgi:hypothetical protein
MTNPEENVEPLETVEPTEETIDMDAKTMSPREMSYLLTSQTFAIIGAIGEGLKSRYDQMMTGIPPKAKKSDYNKGYIQALNDVAYGLMQYQDEITERGIADGVLTREDVPDLPAPMAAATDVDESSE